MLIGEAPGANEQEQKRPFIGRAGEIIRSVLHYAQPEGVFLTNTCLCRPPENRNPSASEIKCCYPRLQREIEEIQPKAIVTLGAVPTRAMVPGASLNKDRGKVKEGNVIPTYHPAATLYRGGDTLLPFIVDDIKKALRIARGEEAHALSVPRETNVFVTDTDEKMEGFIERLYQLEQGTLIAFDWETYGTSPLWHGGYCISFSWAPGTAVVVPMRMVRKHSQGLAKALQDKTLGGFNALMFDALFDRKYRLPDKVVYDGMLMHYCLDERPQQRSLENLTVQRLDAPAYESELFGSKGKKETMLQDFDEATINEYAGKDADWTLRLLTDLKAELQQDQELQDLYFDLIVPAANAMAEVQQNGVLVDRDGLLSLINSYQEECDTLWEQLQQITGNPKFNPRSPQQVQAYLWDELGLQQPDIYGRDDRSVDKQTREVLHENYPDNWFVPALHRYKNAYTMYSRYLRDLVDYIEPDGRIRCSYHLDRTETGRLSTTRPALHQIPRESDIRGVFVAPPGHKLIQADYEQIEIRMAAHIAEDEKLIQLLWDLEEQGSDFHTMMASQAFQVPVEKVSKEMRQAAKAVSFGLLYLMSDKKLADGTGLNEQEAMEVVKRYKAMMPRVWEWVDEIRRQLIEEKVITSPFGRRRRFPMVTRENLNSLHREAVNFPVQSGASDLTLTSLIRVHNSFKNYYPEAKVVLSVHDSVISECPDFLLRDVTEFKKRIMEKPALDTKVPFPVEVKVGQRWGEEEDVSLYCA